VSVCCRTVEGAVVALDYADLAEAICDD